MRHGFFIVATFNLIVIKWTVIGFEMYILCLIKTKLWHLIDKIKKTAPWKLIRRHFLQTLFIFTLIIGWFASELSNIHRLVSHSLSPYKRYRLYCRNRNIVGTRFCGAVYTIVRCRPRLCGAVYTIARCRLHGCAVQYTGLCGTVYTIVRYRLLYCPEPFTH